MGAAENKLGDAEQFQGREAKEDKRSQKYFLPLKMTKSRGSKAVSVAKVFFQSIFDLFIGIANVFSCYLFFYTLDTFLSRPFMARC